MEQDCLIRGIHSGMGIRVVWAEVTGLVNAAITIHDADPAAAQALADLLGAAVVASAMLDDGEKFSIRIDYPGSLRGLLAEAAANGAVRGLVFVPHPLAAGEGDVTALYGGADGMIAVTRSDDKGRILNSGQTRAPLADAAGDLGFYFSVSDQVETEIHTWIRWQGDPSAPVARMSVLMLQALPDCNLEAFGKIRNAMHAKELARFFPSLEIAGNPGQFLDSVIGEAARLAGVSCDNEPANYVPGAIPHWQCRCSREVMKRAMATLGEKELAALFDERPEPHIECQFCRRNYVFHREDFFAESGV